MERFLVAAALLLAAVAVAYVLDRRRPDAPTQARYAVPTQLDRTDFDRPDAPWLVAVFTSATCDSCAKATQKAEVLASSAVGYQAIPYQSRRELHDRYHIGAVPTTLLADDRGVVVTSFIGDPPAADLWAAVAEAREPGSTPDPDCGRPR